MTALVRIDTPPVLDEDPTMGPPSMYHADKFYRSDRHGIGYSAQDAWWANEQEAEEESEVAYLVDGYWSRVNED